jgi:hypothetical protein
MQCRLQRIIAKEEIMEAFYGRRNLPKKREQELHEGICGSYDRRTIFGSNSYICLDGLQVMNQLEFLI